MAMSNAGMHITRIIHALMSIVAGVFVLHAQQLSYSIRNISEEEIRGLSGNRAIVEDHRGIIYVGSREGIFEYDGVSWRIIRISDNRPVFSLAVDLNGRVLVGAQDEFGFLRCDAGGAIHFVSLRAKLHRTDSGSIGTINRIVTAQNSVHFISDKKILTLPVDNTDAAIREVTSEDFIYSVVFDQHYLLVSEGMRGLMHLVNGVFEPIPGGELIQSHVMINSARQSILIVTPFHGIYRFTGGSGSIKGNLIHLSHAPEFVGMFDIKCGTALRNGRFALGSVSDGCFILDSIGSMFEKIGQQQGLLSNVVYDVFEDSNENLWLGMENGVAVIRPVAVGNPDDYHFKSFVRSFRGRNTDSTCFDGCFLGSSETPADSQPKSQVLKFHFKVNAFRFSYAANFYPGADSTRFQYRLDGLDVSWSEWSPRTYCEYTNLDYGKYTFLVRAKNVYDKISPEAKYSFVILTPWYKTWWYYCLQVAVMALLLFLASFLYSIGKAEWLAGSITGTIVVIIFGYFKIVISPFLRQVSTGIALFDLIFNMMIGNIIKPVQKRTNRFLDGFAKVGKKKREELYTDKVTRLYNSTYLTEFLEKEVARAVRYRKDLSCITIKVKNLDDAARIAGQGGREAVLLHVAGIVKTNTRKADIAGFLSEGFFCVILPETDRKNAKIVVDKITRLVTSTPFTDGKHVVLLSLRSGIASVGENPVETAEGLIESARNGTGIATDGVVNDDINSSGNPK